MNTPTEQATAWQLQHPRTHHSGTPPFHTRLPPHNTTQLLSTSHRPTLPQPRNSRTFGPGRQNSPLPHRPQRKLTDAERRSRPLPPGMHTREAERAAAMAGSRRRRCSPAHHATIMPHRELTHRPAKGRPASCTEPPASASRVDQLQALLQRLGVVVDRVHDLVVLGDALLALERERGLERGQLVQGGVLR